MGSHASSIADLLVSGVAELRAAGIELPRFEAELLLCAATGLTRERILSYPEQSVSPPAAAAYRRLVLRRAGHEPLAYITGRKEFMSLDLEVTRDVLVPRPDSELLVEQALSYLQTGQLPGAYATASPSQPQPSLPPLSPSPSPVSTSNTCRPDEGCPLVVDVGTGSGALALAIAAGCPDAQVWGVDISAAAAAVARRNAVRLGLTGRVRIVTGDLLAAPGLPAGGGFDLIVANLPYVGTPVLEHLAPEVAMHEPRLALDGGPDGLALIRRLLPQAPAALGPRGAIGLECDSSQCTLVYEMLLDAGFVAAAIGHDLAGRPRTVWGVKGG